LHLVEPDQKPPELTNAELEQDGRVIVLELHVHDLRERIQPGQAIVDLKHCLATGLEDTTALADQLPRIGGVLYDAVRIDEIERRVGTRKLFSVGDAELCVQTLLFEVRSSQIDRRRSDIDAGDDCAAPCKPRQVHSGSASHFEHAAAGISLEVDQPQQMMELLEVILIEVFEETARSDRMPRDFEIVNVPVPVISDLVD